MYIRCILITVSSLIHFITVKMPLYMLVCCPRPEFKAVIELFMPKHQRRTYHMLLQKSAPIQSSSVKFILQFMILSIKKSLLVTTVVCYLTRINNKRTRENGTSRLQKPSVLLLLPPHFMPGL